MIYKPGKVLILDQPDPFLPHFLVENGFTVTIDTASDFNDLKSSLAGYQGVILRSRWTLDPLFFEAASQLLFVGRLGVGTEHIDAREVIKNGIRLFTTPEGSKDTVAEHTLGLILMLLNKLPTGCSPRGWCAVRRARPWRLRWITNAPAARR